MEKHGDHPKDDVKLRPIICFLEGAVHNIFQDYDYAQNVEFLCFSFRFFSYSSLLVLRRSFSSSWWFQIDIHSIYPSICNVWTRHSRVPLSTSRFSSIILKSFVCFFFSICLEFWTSQRIVNQSKSKSISFEIDCLFL